MAVAVDTDESQKLFADNLGLVGDVVELLWISQAVRRIGAREDVEQIGRIGLLSAARQYPVTQPKCAFSTYAWSAIRRAILEGTCRDAYPPGMTQLNGESSILDKSRPELCEKPEKTKSLKKLLSQLKPDYRFVLVHRFGLLGRPQMTLAQIGDKLGVTKQWVEEIQTNALRIMREWIGSDETIDNWLRAWQN